jgi:hypothetical protein
MIEIPNELNVERLLGRRACDPNGEIIGRLEEMIVDVVDGEPVIVEYRFGAAAMLERIAGFMFQLPFFSLIPRPRKLYRVRWDQLDLSDPRHPRTLVPRRELETLND